MRVPCSGSNVLSRIRHTQGTAAGLAGAPQAGRGYGPTSAPHGHGSFRNPGRLWFLSNGSVPAPLREVSQLAREFSVTRFVLQQGEDARAEVRSENDEGGE